MNQGLVQYDEDDEDAGPVHTITGNISGGTTINWPSSGGVFQSGNIPNFQGVTGISGISPIGGFSYPNLGTAGTVTITATQKPKTDVIYVIVDKAGKCMELQERKMMSPREVINVCKFLSVVAAVQHTSTKINWTELVESLGITDQFVEGESSAGHYVTGEETLFVFLID